MNIWKKRNVRWSLAALLTLLLTVVCAGVLAENMSLSNDTYFKDANFREYLKTFDQNTDGSLSEEERNAVEQIYCDNRDIGSLEGIQYFPNLRVLSCPVNKITKIDVSANTKLEDLYFSNNKVSELKLGNIQSLTDIYCEHNLLKTIDLSKCNNMQRLYLTDNKLTTLNVSHMIDLEELNIGTNQVGKVDVSHNQVLRKLFVYSCGLSSLDVTANRELEVLHCDRNSLKSLNLSQNSMLFNLDCRFNQMPTLNIAPCSREINNLVQSKEPVAWDDTTVKWGGSKVSDPTLFIDNTVRVTTKNSVWPNITAVKLNKNTASLTRTSKKPKPTLQLKAAVVPTTLASCSFTWTSSNKKVATVSSSGKVTALKAGKVTITCTENGSGKKGTCTITITDRKVKKITLNKKTATLKVGKKLQLKVKFSPADAVNQQVKWASSNRKVATVDQNGKVTAKKAGKCVITCMSMDGGKKAACKITVK